MKNDYPYLRDPRAISEIRKHQWIESEKAGREIGFGTAAVDWIAKYGEAWKKAHAVDTNDKRVLFEQRKYRRFALETMVTLAHNDAVSLVRTVDVSYRGMLCKTQQPLSVGRHTVIKWPFDPDGRSGLAFEGTVERISAHKDAAEEYTMLLKFSQGTCEKIENFDFLKINQQARFFWQDKD